MKTQQNKLDEPVTIHFKEDSIPELKRGKLTEESKQAIKELFISKLPEKEDMRPEITEWLISKDYSDGYNKAIDDIKKIWEEL